MNVARSISFLQRWRACSLLLLLVSFLLIHGLLHQRGGSIFELDRTTVQVIVFPLMLWIVSQLSIGGAQVPRRYIIGALVCALISVGWSYTYRGDESRIFLVARLADDALESDSRLFRERLNAVLERTSDARAVRYYRSFKEYREVRQFMASRKVQAVVWGNRRWLNVAFADRPTVTLQDVARGLGSVTNGGSPLQHYPSFEIVQSVPAIGLSYAPELYTSSFLAELLTGTLPRSYHLADGTGSEAGKEMALASAASIVAGWTSRAHRAYPLWVLGNMHLLRALRGPKPEIGETRCALAFYRKARHFLQRHDNPELMAAIANNFGVAIFVQGTERGKPAAAARAALTKFMSAARERGRRNLLQAELRSPEVALRNIERLPVTTLMLIKRRAGQSAGPRKDGPRKLGARKVGPRKSPPQKNASSKTSKPKHRKEIVK